MQGTAATGLTPDVVYSFAVTADNNQGNGHDVQSAASTTLTADAPSAVLSATAPVTVAEGASFDLTLASSLPGGGPSPSGARTARARSKSSRVTPSGTDGGALANKFAEHKWLGYNMNVAAGKYTMGGIYETTVYHTVVAQKSVTYQQADAWKKYMKTRVGTPDYYDPVTLSCVTFSHLEYDNAPDKKP